MDFFEHLCPPEWIIVVEGHKAREREYMHPPDSELVAKAKNKDKQAFVELFKRYKDKIYGYLSRYLGDYETAKDLTVDTFLSVYENLATYKEEGKFSSWIYRIATNCAKKEFRKKTRYAEISLERPVDTEGTIKLGDLMADEKARPDHKAEIGDLKEFVYKMVSQLDEKYKDAILLCDVEGLTYDEAAKVLKSNPETVHTRVVRARKLLYKVLRKYKSEF
ncbi:RNA polymerase sigma factor [Candidatus Omnitrophota bacterium]